jgi:ATP-dependent helicase/nuclease subunit A
LLGCVRDLLVRDPATRTELQRRFRYVLVDEFQDTDPLQAEIVFLLCEREPIATDWRSAVLEPGKLFVVGDPKQSIYRFRRADIALYDEVKELVRWQPGGAVEVITQNFRTTPSLVAWVNTVFDTVFGDDAEPGRQPGYHRVDAYRPDAEGARVAVLLGREYGTRGASGGADAARRDEAAALASLLATMHDADTQRWSVQDRDAPGVAIGAEAVRPPRWGDIALLFRATTGLETYEQALREAGVPYRVEGGKTYFSRREVADALLCLRAADDPSDGPALYGALHSSLFGFSDDDLFLFRAAGGSFDLFAATQPEGGEAIAGAMATLRALHERSREDEPHETVAALVRLAHAAEFLGATGPDAPQAIANLEKLTQQALAFSKAGGGGLGAFLRWAAEVGEAAGEQESQVDDEGDVVHLLTIHKAKGLEFPIVVLVGGALSGGGGGRESVRPIVDRAGRRLAVKLNADLPGGAARSLEPQAYTSLNEREKEMGASELRRLLYVAATRARDRLVVSCFGKLTTKGDEPAAGVLLAPLAGDLPAAGPEPPADDHECDGLLVLAPLAAPPRVRRAAAADPAALTAARDTWLIERAALLARAARPAAAVSPSGLEHVDAEVRTGGPGAPPGRTRALVLGAAVHEALQLCDLDDDASLLELAVAITRDLGHPDLAEEAAALAVACWRSAPVRAAAASPEVYRELPVGAMVGGVVLSGAVDLLYRDGDDWVVVDYKTDRGADAATLLERYTPQGAAYAVAVEAASGGVVREVAFVAAAAGGLVVTVPVDERLRELVGFEIAAAAEEGRPIRADELGEADGDESAQRRLRA